jgi:branched-chain amino acid transport system substrate-binding protein
MKKKNLLGFLVCALLVVTSGLALAACAPETIVETVIVTQMVEVEGEEVEVTRVVEVEVTPEPEVESWEDWETIKIGCPTLLTGIGAPMGIDVQAGVGFAVEAINAEGGVLGKPLEVVYADVKATGAEDCALAAQVMDRAGVVAYFPGAFYGAACIHEFGKREGYMPHGSASTDMVEAVVDNLPEYRNVFQICASEPSYGPNAYDILVNQIPYELPNKKAALLGGDITYDMLIQQGFEDVAVENGWEIVLDDTYPYGTTEFGAQLAKIRAEEPAIIFGCLTSTDSSVAFMNQFLENPTNSLIYIQWSPASPEFIGLLGEKANGVMWQTLIAYLPTPENEEWAEAFNTEFGRYPGAAWPAIQEDVIRMWKTAVETCGSPVDHECIYDYMETLNDHPYTGRCGSYGTDPERHEGLTGDEWTPMHFVQIQDQRDHTLYLGTQLMEGEEFIVPPWIK